MYLLCVSNKREKVLPVPCIFRNKKFAAFAHNCTYATAIQEFISLY